MNGFIAICVALVALTSVRCDLVSDTKARIAKLTAMYNNMSDAEIRPHVVTNVRAIEAIMENAVKHYLKEDLQLVATIDLDIIKYLDQGMAKVLAAMDKRTDKLKHIDYVQMVVISEVIRGVAENEDKRRATNPVKVTDTADNLKKTYLKEYKELLELLKWTVDNDSKKAELSFWKGVHQAIHDYIAHNEKEIVEALAPLSKETQAKNLSVMIADMRLLVKAVSTRGKTYSSKFTETVHKIYSDVKQFFAKIF